MVAFIATFFGLFVIINGLTIIIFPVSWNDVVTCPAWIGIYFIIGLICSVMVVDTIINNPD